MTSDKYADAPTHHCPPLTNSSACSVRIPHVLWAQRKDVVYLTFEVVEAQDEAINVTDTNVSFSATQRDSGDRYVVSFDLYDKVDPSATVEHKTDRAISVTLTKADKEAPFWPRLVSDKKKPHFLGTDFARWKDEDEVSEGDLDPSFGRGGMDFSQLASMAGGGFPGMGGFGGGEEEEEEEEEETEDQDDDPYQKTSKTAVAVDDE